MIMNAAAFGEDGGNRTRKAQGPSDFKSDVSTDSTTSSGADD